MERKEGLHSFDMCESHEDVPAVGAAITAKLRETVVARESKLLLGSSTVDDIFAALDYYGRDVDIIAMAVRVCFQIDKPPIVEWTATSGVFDDKGRTVDGHGASPAEAQAKAQNAARWLMARRRAGLLDKKKLEA